MLILSSKGIMYNIEYVDPNSSHYNSSVNVGLIGDQSIHSNTLLDNISNITFYVVNSKSTDTEEKDDNNEIIEESDEEIDIIEDLLN